MPEVFRGVRAYARGARSLPEGRRRAPRERSDREDQARGRGRIPRRSQSARSRAVSLLPRSARETTHAASYWTIVGHQLLARRSIAAPGISRDVRAYARRSQSARSDDGGPSSPQRVFSLSVPLRYWAFSEASGLTLAAREVSQWGGGARRGSEATARDQASDVGRIPRRSQSARSRGVSLLPRSARETTHAASYWAMVGHQVLSRRSIAAPGIFRDVRTYARGARSLPEGRRRAPRERSDCAGSGERSKAA